MVDDLCDNVRGLDALDEGYLIDVPLDGVEMM